MTSLFLGAFLQSFQKNLRVLARKRYNFLMSVRERGLDREPQGFKDDHSLTTYHAKMIHTQVQVHPEYEKS